MTLTNKEKFNKKYNQPLNKSNSFDDIVKLSGIKKSILKEVYKRGIGAWKTNIESVRLKKDFSKDPNIKKYPRSARLTKEQWAVARVYSFIMGGKTQKTADKDLAIKARLIKE
jgi:hypothetical protein